MEINLPAGEITVKTDADSVVTVKVSEKTTYERMPPREADRSKAVEIALTNITVGDGIWARGYVAEDRKSVPAQQIFVISYSDVVVQIASIAMEASLKKGGRVLIIRDIRELKRGDIVTYHYPSDESQLFISKVIGLPNEEIEIREGRVLVDGKHIDEAYVNPDNNRSLRSQKPMKIPERKYFVMGDNRDNSNDSRAWAHYQRSLSTASSSRSIECLSMSAKRAEQIVAGEPR